MEVSAAAQLFQPTPAVQTLMGPTQVQELPLNNRNFVQLATLVPGVTSSLADEVGIGLASMVSLSIAGARRNAVNWLVDGASIVDVGSNMTLLATPTLESIEEFKIITSGYAAEWPRSGGGIVNVVTKSGTNSFRASAYEFFRHDALNANGFFRKQSTTPPSATSPPEARATTTSATRWAGPSSRTSSSSSGPRSGARSRARPAPPWRTSRSGLAHRSREPQLRGARAARPERGAAARGLAGPQPGPNRYRPAPERPGHAAGGDPPGLALDPRWRLMGRYTHDLSETTEAAASSSTPPVPDIATTETRVPGQVGVAQLTTTLSPHMLNELSFQFSGNAIKSEYGETRATPARDYGLAIPELFPENREGLIPTVGGHRPSRIGARQLFDNRYRNYTLADNLSWQRGDHAFKGGFLVAFERKDELSTSLTQGNFNFRPAAASPPSRTSCAAMRGGAAARPAPTPSPSARSAAAAPLQALRALRPGLLERAAGLTLDLGLRYSLRRRCTDENDLLTNFVPARFDPARAPAVRRQRAAPRSAGHRRSAERDRRGRAATRPTAGAIYATDKNNFSLGWASPGTCRNDGHDGPARRLRHLLRPAAHRDLPAERLRRTRPS